VLLRIASVTTLVALALIVWSLFDVRPLPVIVAMSVAQAIGTASFAAYGVAVVADLKRMSRKPQEPR
jgi:hypothetical protein